MSDLNEVGAKDGWRCWLCDGSIDPEASVNSDLGPSVDSFAVAKNKKGTISQERIAHRECNTKKGKIAPVVPWGSELFVADPAPIVATVDRLSRKGGREVVARCPNLADAEQASIWLLDRLSRFAPGMELSTQIVPGGGQFMLVLQAK